MGSRKKRSLREVLDGLEDGECNRTIRKITIEFNAPEDMEVPDGDELDDEDLEDSDLDEEEDEDA